MFIGQHAKRLKVDLLGAELRQPARHRGGRTVDKNQAANVKNRCALEEAVAVIIERAWKIGPDEMFFLLGDGLLPRDVILHSFELFATKVRSRFASV